MATLRPRRRPPHRGQRECMRCSTGVHPDRTSAYPAVAVEIIGIIGAIGPSRLSRPVGRRGCEAQWAVEVARMKAVATACRDAIPHRGKPEGSLTDLSGYSGDGHRSWTPTLKNRGPRYKIGKVGLAMSRSAQPTTRPPPTGPAPQPRTAAAAPRTAAPRRPRPPAPQPPAPQPRRPQPTTATPGRNPPRTATEKPSAPDTHVLLAELLTKTPTATRPPPDKDPTPPARPPHRSEAASANQPQVRVSAPRAARKPRPPVVP